MADDIMANKYKLTHALSIMNEGRLNGPYLLFPHNRLGVMGDRQPIMPQMFFSATFLCRSANPRPIFGWLCSVFQLACSQCCGGHGQ